MAARTAQQMAACVRLSDTMAEDVVPPSIPIFFAMKFFALSFFVAIALLWSGCITKPVDIIIPQAESKLVVASQIVLLPQA